MHHDKELLRKVMPRQGQSTLQALVKAAQRTAEQPAGIAQDPLRSKANPSEWG